MEKSVGTYMIKGPFVGEPESTPQEALELMVECGVRHLPIVENGKLVGLVSERDLKSVVSLPQANKLTLRDVMKRDVYIARRTTPLREIVRQMQEDKLGSTVVVNDTEEVVGIFTVTDALGILADLLEDSEESRSIFLEDFEEHFDSWRPAATA